MDEKITPGESLAPTEKPVCAGIFVSDGIELTDWSIFMSPPACCGAAALPFWAKVTGKLKNTEDRDVFVRVSIRLMGSNQETIGSYSEAFVIDGGEMCQFDVKLLEYSRGMDRFSIEIEEIDEDGLI